MAKRRFVGWARCALPNLLRFVLGRLYPALPIAPPLWAVAAALVAGMLFAWLPARRAAKLDAALALARR